MRVISDGTRERAAIICAIAASNGESALVGIAVEAFGFDTMAWLDAENLATLAWYEADESFGTEAESFAEAEAMLRCGWSPK